jgi:2-phospho-L-lactate guanylyltransferase
MIDDVLSVVCQTEGISGLVVITNDEDVRTQARLYNARIMAEPDARDLPGARDLKGLASANKEPGAEGDGIETVGVERLNQVFAMAMKQLAEEGEDGVLLLPADVPLMTVENLKQMLAHHKRPGVTIVPASADGGTNAMMVSPPQLIAPGYGHRSCQRHSEFARAVGIEPQVLESLGTDTDTGTEELGLDVDTVDDLRELMAAPVNSKTQRFNSQTQRFLLDSDIMERIECLDQQGLAPGDQDRKSLDQAGSDKESLDIINALPDGRKTA